MKSLVFVLCQVVIVLETRDEDYIKPCELVEILKETGIKDIEWASWVCLADSESGLRFDLVGQNRDGSISHGIFQISDKYWCTRDGPPGKKCNINCAALRQRDQTASVRCAKKIYHMANGFSAWASFEAMCAKNKPNIEHCRDTENLVPKYTTRCAVYTKMLKMCVPMQRFNDWLCLIELQSRLQYNVINENPEGSLSHGLFQINEQFWCNREPIPGKGCNAICDDMRLPDITKALECALIIYSKHKFSAWNLELEKCPPYKLELCDVSITEHEDYSRDCLEDNKLHLREMLLKHDFPEDLLDNWVCLVENESKFRHALIRNDKDGSQSHGIFMINDKYWCTKKEPPGKGCNVTCQALRSYNLSTSAECAKIIYERHGFKAWFGYMTKCDELFHPVIPNNNQTNVTITLQ